SLISIFKEVPISFLAAKKVVKNNENSMMHDSVCRQNQILLENCE
ncbi:MAG: hypothetical protein H6Q56_1703, partial [Deltaproteobacteria bacterium]|nr:hypothetical protein [Deltaproteobacteria bacterium]